MAVDISHLSPEQHAFLKVNPELLKSLEGTIQREAQSVHVKREKLRKGKSDFQRKMEEVEEKARKLKHDLSEKRLLIEVERKYLGSTQPTISGKLRCPQCGADDAGNVMNGEPWCFKCNRRLTPK